jgi:hypothetical protein
MKKVDLQTAIATIITYPNKKWKNLKREKIHGTKIILPKQLKLNLKPLCPTDYLSIPT